MGNAIAFWIAVGVTSVICYALITRAENAGRRRAGAGSRSADGGSEFSSSNDGYWLTSWFSSAHSSLDSSGSPADNGSCTFSSDAGGSDSGGGDCGGGGDGGGGGGSD